MKLKPGLIVLAALAFIGRAAIAAEASFDMTGVWMPTAIGPDDERTQVYPDGIPYLPETDAARAAFEANYNPVVDDPSRSCLPYGMPRQMLVRAQYPTEIIQTGDRLTMVVELHNDVRRIYLDGRQRQDGQLPSYMGFSTGHWEGDTLVIETTDIRANGFPNPQSDKLKVTERIRMVDGGDVGDMLEFSMTIDDPAYYSRPFTAINYFRQYPGLEMGEYFCSEDLWRQNLDGKTGEYIPWR